MYFSLKNTQSLTLKISFETAEVLLKTSFWILGYSRMLERDSFYYQNSRA